MRLCPKCGQLRDPRPAYWWTGESLEEICQDCWEAECSASWWEMVNAINDVEGEITVGQSERSENE